MVPLNAFIELKPYMSIAGSAIWQRPGNQRIKTLKHEGMIYFMGKAFLASWSANSVEGNLVCKVEEE